MNATPQVSCPACGAQEVLFKAQISQYLCKQCFNLFTQPSAIEPQTIFLSYAHKSERDEDFDVSEELVLLIKAELDKDGHTVWIDKDGIRAGSQWRERITAAILEHAHFLSFLSRRSVRDPGVCLNEIATALGSTRNVQTVLTQAEREVAAPLTISHLQWHDFQDWREIRAGTRSGPDGQGWGSWFDQRMALVRETIGSAQSTRVSGELQRLKEILLPTSFEARIIEKTQGFYGRQWLFDATQAWLDESSSRMFWLKASPGIGKSAFAAQLTHQTRSAVIGFFMCDFQGKKDPEESAREAICTLAFQMASRLPDYRLKLLHQQQVDKEKILKKSADDLFAYLITEPLNKAGKIPESTRLCLVIDGLDEAGRSDHGNALAELLVKHVERLPDWLGIIVTSRPEPYLEQILKPLSGISFDGQTEHNRQDLVAWIDSRLPAQLAGQERQRIIEAVIDKSGGTFLYLRLMEEDKSLNMATPENLPDKLDGMFKQNFNRYFPDPRDFGNMAEPFLRLMVAAPGPLPAQMGRHILDWSQRELTLKVIEPLGSLLQERDGGLVFFHASLADWLKDPRRSGTHCVNDTGAQELGAFIWRQFENFESSPWKLQVVQWLATLMVHTEHWHETQALKRVAQFLGERLRPRDSLRLHQRALERISQTVGADSAEAAHGLQCLGQALALIGNSAQALLEFRRALKICEGLAALEPANPGDRHAVSVCLSRIGALLVVQGDLAGALVQHAQARSILDSLLAQQPENAGWQHELAVSLSSLGDIVQAQGDLSGALVAFQQSLAIMQQLGSPQLDNAAWRHGVSVCHNHIGDLLEAQGDLSGALTEFEQSLAIMEDLVTQEPHIAEWQWDLAVGHSRVGALLDAQFDLPGALVALQKGLAIKERLAALEPDNAHWQLGLCSSHGRIGEVLHFLGDLEAALAAFRKSQKVSERLAALDPLNAHWQHELAGAYMRVGTLLEWQGDLPEALVAFRQDRAIIERLAALDPSQADWQNSLNESYNSIGNILMAQGDLTGALEEFRLALAISVRLVALESDSVLWQRNLGLSHKNIGTLLEEQGDLVGALAAYREEGSIRARLALEYPETADWRLSLAVNHRSIAGVLQEQGHLAQALAEFRLGWQISEGLAVADPNNPHWARLLGNGHASIGRILHLLGDQSGALAQYRDELRIRQALVAQDPENAAWQREMARSQESIHDILQAQTGSAAEPSEES